MSKKWYSYFLSIEPSGAGAAAGQAAEGAAEAAPASPSGPSAAQTIADIAASVKVEPKFSAPVPSSASFDEIYRAAEIRPPAHGFTIFKVAEMLRSEHIRNLPVEVKRSSVLLALEAAGVKLQEMIEDAIRRDRALDMFENVQERAVQQLETQKTEENKKIQTEIDRLVKEHQTKIQANNDLIAKERERFLSWRIQKQQEEQRIADAIGPFVSENPVTTGAARKTP